MTNKQRKKSTWHWNYIWPWEWPPTNPFTAKKFTLFGLPPRDAERDKSVFCLPSSLPYPEAEMAINLALGAPTSLWPQAQKCGVIPDCKHTQLLSSPQPKQLQHYSLPAHPHKIGQRYPDRSHPTPGLCHFSKELLVFSLLVRRRLEGPS